MNVELTASIYGAVLGALSGGVISIICDSVMDLRRRRIFIEDQIKDIAFDFSACVQTYWSMDGSDKMLESTILSHFSKINAKLAQIGIDPIKDTNVRFLMKEIFQISTGGSFATVRHAADRSRINIVRDRIESLVSVVMGPKCGWR
jgi:hypothetical protein